MITNTINPEWTKYDQMVASCHLSNFGTIYLDEWGFPIDNEYELEEKYHQTIISK